MLLLTIYFGNISDLYFGILRIILLRIKALDLQFYLDSKIKLL